MAVCSSDHYFVCPCCRAYTFDAERLGAAHSWCQRKCMKAMEGGVNAVIVDNTNCTARECRTYVLLADQFAYDVEFLEPETPWAFNLDELFRRNVHGVPREGLERMLRRWVTDMTVEKALGETPPGVMTADEQSAGQNHQ